MNAFHIFVDEKVYHSLPPYVQMAVPQLRIYPEPETMARLFAEAAGNWSGKGDVRKLELRKRPLWLSVACGPRVNPHSLLDWIEQELRHIFSDEYIAGVQQNAKFTFQSVRSVPIRVEGVRGCGSNAASDLRQGAQGSPDDPASQQQSLQPGTEGRRLRGPGLVSNRCSEEGHSQGRKPGTAATRNMAAQRLVR